MARITTARFMRDCPGPISDLNPAVPNSRSPEKSEVNLSMSLFLTKSKTCFFVVESGSCLAQFLAKLIKFSLTVFQ